jgi:TRAP-type C4-dicarboxylate transport system permease small subunit
VNNTRGGRSHLVSESLDRSLIRFCGILVGGIVLVMLADIAGRNLLGQSLTTAAEIAVLLQLYVVFIAAAVGYRRGAHMLVGSNRWLGKQGVKLAEKVVHLSVATFSLVLGYYGLRLAAGQWGQLSPSLQIPVTFFYFSMPLGCMFTTVFCVLLWQEDASQGRQPVAQEYL